MTETLDIVEQDLERRIDSLDSKVLLLSPTLGTWHGHYQLPTDKVQTSFDGTAVEEGNITTPRVKLLTDKYPLDSSGTPWKKRFQVFASELTKIKDKYSVRFPIAGVRIVPKAKGSEFMHELFGSSVGMVRRKIAKYAADGMDPERHNLSEELRGLGFDPAGEEDADTLVCLSHETPSLAYRLQQTRKEFCDNLEDVMRQIAENNALYVEVQDRIPHTPQAMASKFYLDVVPIELAGGQSNKLTMHELADHQDIVREACRRRVEEAIEEIIEGPRQQLADAIENLKNLIARDGRVNSRSFKPIHDAIAKIRLFDFVADATLLSKIKELETRLNVTPANSLDRQNAATSGFTAALDAYQAEVTDAVARQRALQEFGNQRALEL